MKSLRAMLSVVLMSLCVVAFAQSHPEKPVVHSEAQQSFDKLKTLAGSWEARVTTVPPVAEMEGGLVQVTAEVQRGPARAQ